MSKDTVVRFRKKEEVVDLLADLLRRGARELIGQAVSEEFEVFLEQHAERRDAEGRVAVVRNGFLPERQVLSGIGPVPVSLPRARDRSGEGLRFHSALVPPYVRRSKSVDAVLPWLYLKGVSTGDMSLRNVAPFPPHPPLDRTDGSMISPP